MCTEACVRFAKRSLSAEVVRGKRVLEVGSYDVNGGVRGIVEGGRPREYLGVDVAPGPGVDSLCPVGRLISRFGPESFDIVISTEMLEHVADWREAISNLKGTLASGGLLLLTTRSRGFPLHGYPYDFWRFEPEDIRVIFADFEILRLERDSAGSPGVLLLARRRLAQDEPDLTCYAVYSVIWRRRVRQIRDADRAIAQVLCAGHRRVRRMLPRPVRRALRQLFNALQRENVA